MSYQRVLPRDLFNEAKLLKCMGMIAMLVVDERIKGLRMTQEECYHGFDVWKNDSDGSISITNILFHDSRGEKVLFWTPLNSKENWPLVMEYKGEEYYPLNSNGEYQLAENLFT